MKTFNVLALGALLVASPAFAQTAAMTTLPAASMSVTSLYKQDVYDGANNKIGSISDVLLTEDHITAVVVGVGGFLGIGEKDVAVPLTAIKQTMKDGKPYLTMDTTKDAMKAAPGFKYDSKTMMWMPDTK
jgi:sporulation protein YlmC with PRC-barrel domain